MVCSTQPIWLLSNIINCRVLSSTFLKIARTSRPRQPRLYVQNWLDVQDKLGLKRKLSFLPEEFKVQIRFPENQTIECSEFKDAMQFITVVSVSLHIRTPKTQSKFDAFQVFEHAMKHKHQVNFQRRKS